MELGRWGRRLVCWRLEKMGDPLVGRADHGAQSSEHSHCDLGVFVQCVKEIHAGEKEAFHGAHRCDISRWRQAIEKPNLAEPISIP